MIAFTTSFFKAFGLVCGREDFVGIKRQPPQKSLRHHREMVLGCTPNRKATERIDQLRYFTKLTASLLTFGIFGFVVYISLILPLSVAKVMIHYDPLTTLAWVFYGFVIVATLLFPGTVKVNNVPVRNPVTRV